MDLAEGGRGLELREDRVGALERRPGSSGRPRREQGPAAAEQGEGELGDHALRVPSKDRVGVGVGGRRRNRLEPRGWPLLGRCRVLVERKLWLDLVG